MKLLTEWLREFAGAPADAAELRGRLSMAGIAVDSAGDSAAGPVLDAEITSNRPDCLGHYGVARELSAMYRVPLKVLDPRPPESSTRVEGAARAALESPDLCGRYTARVIRGVTIRPSPDWLRRRLEAIGQNAINNVVDITNYVMFELGQPLHAFDLARLAGKRIVVRRARPGEKLRSLDGIERALSEGMCVIGDAARAVAIAGVIGGAESEIGPETREILLESAWFNPISVRRAAKSLGVRTEASYRFERGADPEMAELASRRAAELILQTAGGELLGGVIDVYPVRKARGEIQLSRRELLRVMGADIPDSEIEAILSALGFDPKRAETPGNRAPAAQTMWICRVPSWRADVSREIDLIEEIARHHGYHKFPARLPAAKQPSGALPHSQSESLVRQRLVALGYQEIVEIPLVDARRDALFRPAGVTPAAIANPLAENASVLRSTGVVSMAGALEWNLNRAQRNLRLFEIGKRYQLRDGEPLEIRILTLGATGLAREKSIHEPAREFGFADLKGDLDNLGLLAGGISWQPGASAWLAQNRSGRFAVCGSERGHDPRMLGVAGQLASGVAEELKFRQAVFLAELELDPLLAAIECARSAGRFVLPPRFPAVERDFSLILGEGVPFSRVAEAIRALEIPELRRIEPADLFRGGQIPVGKFSLMIRVTFQSAETTLTDSQLASFSSRIAAALEQQLGASLRSS